MSRHLLAFALVLSGFVGSASAQVGILPYPSPWYPPMPNPGIQYLGTLPNGIPVINPWNMYQNHNYGQNYPGGFWRPNYNPYVYNPYLYNPIPAYYGNLYASYLGYLNQNPYNVPNIYGVERERGRFIPVANDLFVNNLTGTQLAPVRGIAQTREGTFYRMPGTGSITAWGAFIPGSGTYVNPVSGDVYNPGSGIIVRR